jgi:hypothetical protein
MAFDLGGLLQKYIGGEPATAAAAAAPAEQLKQDYGQVAQHAPAEAVGDGLSAAFRSDQTPPFAEMVGKLFGNANPQQQSGMLGSLISGLSPAVLGSIGGGIGSLFGNKAGDSAAVTPADASQLTPEQVQEIAAKAEQHNPGIIDTMSRFYATHPDLVKTIGSAGLAIAMASIANRNRS